MKSKNLYSIIIKNLTRKYLIFLILIVVLIVGHFSDPIFSSLRNQKNILHDFSVPFILSIGQTMVIIMGGIDLSFASVVTLAGVTIVILLQKMGILVSIIIILLMGMGIGAINGYFISKFRILPFIVTLSTMIIWEGVALLITKSKPIPINMPSFHIINYGSLLGVIPLPWVYSFTIFTLAVIFLHFHVIGRRIYQIGNDEEIVRRAGVKVNRIKIGVYALNGIIAAFGGIVVASRMSMGDPTGGAQFLFPVIAAVGIGGTSLMGGQGGVIGTLGGMLLMVNLLNILILNNVSIYIQDAIKGFIILISVIILSMRK